MWQPVEPAAQATAKEWLLALVASFESEQLADFLQFCTGRRTISGVRANGDPEKDAIYACVYEDRGKPSGRGGGSVSHYLLTASTCSRVLWVPWWMPGGMAQEQFDEQVLSTLKQYAAEKAIMAGGAALAFE